MTIHKQDKPYYELELGKGKRKVFLLAYLDPWEIWVDFEGLPKSAFLCSMFDGVQMLQAKVGEKKNVSRIFVNIEWAINNWGGNQQIVDSLKKRKQMILDDEEYIRKKIAEEKDAEII